MNKTICNNSPPIISPFTSIIHFTLLFTTSNSPSQSFFDTIEKNESRKGIYMKLISWNIDSLNAALTSDSARAQLSQAVLQTLVGLDGYYRHSRD